MRAERGPAVAAGCAGSAALNSIALFWDRRSDDRYLGFDLDSPAR